MATSSIFASFDIRDTPVYNITKLSLAAEKPQADFSEPCEGGKYAEISCVKAISYKEY